MRLFALVVFVCVMLLATCSAPELAPARIETEMPSLSTADRYAAASYADGGGSLRQAPLGLIRVIDL